MIRRLFLAWTAFELFAYYIRALIRIADGTFWATSWAWLTFVYAANEPAWSDLVYDDIVRRRG